tara:strand:- start:99 stop:404 length:306 start_codon:yes stop_codon:yes gene_type:complete
MFKKIREMDKDLLIFYLSMLGIFIWALLKSFEIIKSPTWQEMLPVFMGLAAALTVVRYIIKLFVRIGVMDHRLINVEGDVKSVGQKLTNINNRLIRVETKL